MSLGGLGLLFCGVCIEPEGEIHESLLIGFGEVATFAGALFGIDYTYKVKNKNPSLPLPSGESTPSLEERGGERLEKERRRHETFKTEKRGTGR